MPQVFKKLGGDDVAPVVWSGDPWLQYAIDEIKNTYGDYVQIKPKSLHKFGRTRNADTDIKTTLNIFPGSEINETFSTTNDIDRLVSSSTSDTETIVIEGHRFDDNNNLVFVAPQEVTLTGQTPAPLATPLCRATRMYVKKGTFAAPASDLVGTVYCYASSGVTVSAGVPQTASAVKILIEAGSNNTEKAATAISYQDYWIVTATGASLQRNAGSTVSAEVELEFRELGGVWRQVGLELSLSRDGTSTDRITLAPYLIVPPNTDVRLVGISNTNSTTIQGFIHGQLALVQV